MDKLMSVEPINYSENELEHIKRWHESHLYKRLVKKNERGEKFAFMDGPPFVSSDSLHFGHLLVSTIKSSVLNFQQMHGKCVENKLGYDCHGLPVEMVVNKLLDVNSPKAIEEMGIGTYNTACKKFIGDCAGSWRSVFDRMGRFLDYDNEYKTMDPNFMETCWWVFKELWTKGLVYEGYRVMPYSTSCCTALSNFEADNFKNIDDPAIWVKFALKDQHAIVSRSDAVIERQSFEKSTYFIVWTTTPWTLPCNLALCVNKELTYVKVLDKKSGETYILVESALTALYKTESNVFDIISRMPGSELVGLEYLPMFDYFKAQRPSYKILHGEFVVADTGSGIVHLAPGFGEDDFNVCIANNVVDITEVGEYCPIDECGKYTARIHDMVGIYVRDANDIIIKRLKGNATLVKRDTYRHSYPFCPRTDVPLIYRAVSSTFIKVTALKDDMLANNDKVKWTPENIGSGRFKQWLTNVKDWGVSRSRYFGTPIPVWKSADGDTICIGSIDELVRLSGAQICDLHREFIDNIVIVKDGKEYHRVSDVFDCWFESGCVPLAQIHYPFENKTEFDLKVKERGYLSEFICEGLDQTRGWFYTLMVISTALFNVPAYDRVICSGIILGEDGVKLSKRHGNYVSASDVINKYSADSLRLYLLGSPATHAESFKFKVDDIDKMLRRPIQLFNGYRFFVEHTIKYAKDGNRFDINAYRGSTELMDVWILSRVMTLLANVEENMINYMLCNIPRLLFDFMEELTNWYIKFNRLRLRGISGDLISQGQALSVLFQALNSFVLISAPFMPFMSEEIFQGLNKIRQANEQQQQEQEEQQQEEQQQEQQEQQQEQQEQQQQEQQQQEQQQQEQQQQEQEQSQVRDINPFRSNDSVFLADYPTDQLFKRNLEIELKMKYIADISSMIRSMREKAGITTTKFPLKCLTIGSNAENQKVIDLIKEVENILTDEVNVMEIKYFAPEQTKMMFKHKIVGNQKSLGKKHRAHAKRIKDVIDTWTPDQVQIFRHNKAIEVSVTNYECTIVEEDVVVSVELAYQCEAYESMATGENFFLIVDSNPSDEILTIYRKRLFVKAVQNMRKTSNLKPWNKIGIYYQSDDTSFMEMVNNNLSELRNLLLMHDICKYGEYVDGSELTIKQQIHDIDNVEVMILITSKD
jgi:isoleucyl-tRNA synthetase